MKGTPHIHTFLEKPSLMKGLGKAGVWACNLYFCYIRKSQLGKVRLIVPACQPGWEEMENF